MNVLLKYSGNKQFAIPMINDLIKGSKASVYIEPFGGSLAIFLNLKKQFDRYIINDLNENLVKVYNSYKSCSVEDGFDKFLILKTLAGNLKDKEQYYKFRDYFNKNLYKTNSIDEGFGIQLLSSSCINGMMRFGPNGFNQGSGARFLIDDTPETFMDIHSRFSKAEINCVGFEELLKDIPKDSLIFIDPPYLSSENGMYGQGWNIEHLNKLIHIVSQYEFIYTDTENQVTKQMNETMIILKEDMNKNSPGNKQAKVLTGVRELLITNLKQNSLLDF